MVRGYEEVICLARYGHVVNHTKSGCWIPGLDCIPTDSLPSYLQSHFGVVRRAVGGIKALGAIAQGTCEAALVPRQFHLRLACDRIQNPMQAMSSLREYLQLSTSGCKHHADWIIASKPVEEAFSYDSRLNLPQMLFCRC